jgi:hypothetical protein
MSREITGDGRRETGDGRRETGGKVIQIKKPPGCAGRLLNGRSLM